MKVAVIIVAVVVIIVLAVILLRQGNPEQTATSTDDTTGDDASDRLYKGVDRPAGPDVEDMSIGDRGIGETSQPGVAPDRPSEPPPR